MDFKKGSQKQSPRKGTFDHPTGEEDVMIEEAKEEGQAEQKEVSKHICTLSCCGNVTQLEPKKIVSAIYTVINKCVMFLNAQK